MSKKPLSREEAENLSKEYQYLSGREFLDGENNSSTVECVTIAPFDPINKLILLHEYKDCRNCEKAMDFYAGYDFDVVVITLVQKERAYLEYADIASFLEQTQVIQNLDTWKDVAQ